MLSRLIVILALVISPTILFAATIQLPATGQVSCWSSAGHPVACDNTGQDGAIKAGVIWQQLRFMDNNDQTVSDSLTRLSWIKDAAAGPEDCDPNVAKNWQQALDYVKCLNDNSYLGYSDWRVPNKAELDSLINIQSPENHDWLNESGFENFDGISCWTSTSYAHDPRYAWYVSMADGYLSASLKSDNLNVIPVRGGQSGQPIVTLGSTGQSSCWNTAGELISCDNSGQDGSDRVGVEWPVIRFNDNGDQTITDNFNGLVWTQDAMAPGPPACTPGQIKTWQEALDYVTCLNNNSYLGFSDWRLPNRTEMQSRLHAEQTSMCAWLSSHGFENLQDLDANYWSSSSYASLPGKAWIVHINDGCTVPNSKATQAYVWPVRAGQHWFAPRGSLLTATFTGELVIDEIANRGISRDGTIGDELAVVDGAGILCGHAMVATDGSYAITVYGDDPATPGTDEGADTGETLTIRLWDSLRHKELPVRPLHLNGSRQTVTWSDNEGGTVNLHGLAQQQIGVFRPGNTRWYADADGNGVWGGLDFYLTGFGISTDKVAAGDWNGDGLLDPGAFRNVNGLGWWYFDSNGNGVWDAGIDQKLQFGYGTDIPVVGDWNGDGKSDFGVFRNINGLGWWYFDSNGNRQWDAGIDQKLQFGIGTDIPVVGDWNGDGKSDFGVFRAKNGLGYWYFDSDGNRAWNSGIDQVLQFGIASDLPVAGDWNGDGLSDFGVMRNGVWYLDSNGNRAWNSGVDQVFPSFGLPGDQPVGGVWR